jgi:ABC-type branched-subunit amino acid transport system ATPase component
MTTTSGADNAVVVRGVTVAFQGLVALNDVDLSAKPGEILGIIGPNGAGKSTLLNCVSGLQPHTGDIEILGRRVSDLPAYAVARMGVGRTFQAPQVIMRATALSNVMLGRHVAMRSTLLGNLVGSWRTRTEEREAKERARGALRFLGLERLADVRASDMSHGDLKVLEVARVLAMDPKVMLLDEPTSGMTNEGRWGVAELLRRVRGEVGAAQLVIEHDVSFMRALCDRLVVLNFGQVLAVGQPDEVLEDERVVAGYLGGLKAAAGHRTGDQVAGVHRDD